MQGDTIQSVAHQLDVILDTGYYSFKLNIDGEVQMTLEYTPSASHPSRMEEGTDGRATAQATGSWTITSQLSGTTEKTPKHDQWNSEQIGDFVRKLGFMDTEKEGGEKIKRFKHINSVSPVVNKMYVCQLTYQL